MPTSLLLVIEEGCENVMANIFYKYMAEFMLGIFIKFEYLNFRRDKGVAVSYFLSFISRPKSIELVSSPPK